METVEDIRLAERYWRNEPDDSEQVTEVLADGEIEVTEIVKEMRANVPEQSD